MDGCWQPLYFSYFYSAPFILGMSLDLSIYVYICTRDATIVVIHTYIVKYVVIIIILHTHSDIIILVHDMWYTTIIIYYLN